jgi:hypothetical protein
MSRSWGRHLLSFVVVSIAGAAMALPACAKNDESIYIAGVLAPSQTRQNGGCTYTNDPTQPRLFDSVLDVGIRDDYLAVLIIANDMIPRGDPNAPRAESNRIHINGAVIRVTAPGGGDLVPSYTTFSSGDVLDTQNNGNPGFQSVGVPIIDGNTANAFRTPGAIDPNFAVATADHVTQKEVLVIIRVFGKTLGGLDVESGEFQHVLKVCNGCLVNYAAGNDPVQMPQPNCLKPVDPTQTSSTTLPCFVGQDEPVDCRLCNATRPACK